MTALPRPAALPWTGPARPQPGRTLRVRIDADGMWAPTLWPSADAHADADADADRFPQGVSMLVRLHVDRLVLGGATPAGDGSVLALGTPSEIDRHPALAPGDGEIAHLDLRGHVLMPGLVNAHTHLDLTHIGPHPFDPGAGFSGFIRLVLANRLTDADAIAASVARGVDLSLRGGVVCVGDIAGVVAGKASHLAVDALEHAALPGVSFMEFFGIGAGEREALAQAEPVLREHLSRRGRFVVPGLSPHAPYTAGRGAYELAQRLADHRVPLCTHAAESPAEREIIQHARGPFRDLLERFGLWNDALAGTLGQGRSPLQHLAPLLGARAWALTHVNDLSDEDLRTLAAHARPAAGDANDDATGWSVLYCPRSSDYFQQHQAFGPHRYRDMLRAGVPVALGTDSVINLPASDRLSTLDEARFLWRRDCADASNPPRPSDLLRMMTTAGARVLGARPDAFTLRPGTPLAGLVSLPVQRNTHRPGDVARQILEVDTPPRLVFLGNPWSV